METKALVEITRPHNCVLAGIVGVLGSIVASGSLPDLSLLFKVFLVVTLGCSGGNTVNDYFDYEIDRINRPERPLPRGAMSRKAALWYSLLLFALGLAVAWSISLTAFIFASLAYLLMFLYAWKLKPMPFIGNLVVAALTGATPIYGAIAVGRLGLTGTLALCAFLVNVAREIVKDIEDIEGDRAKGAKTLPILTGPRKAAWIAAVFGLGTVGASFLPVKAGVGVGYYAMIPVDVLILYAVYTVVKNPSRENAHRSQLILKMSIFLAVLAFLFAVIL